MKKILLILLSFFLFVGTSYAAMQGIEIRAKELMTSENIEELYDRVDILNIEDDEDITVHVAAVAMPSSTLTLRFRCPWVLPPMW